MLYSPLPENEVMHIPDGFVSIPVAILMWIISTIVIAIALKKVKKVLGEKQIPLMGVMAAAIFAGQMLNFGISGGTSGHLLGATLAVILLGPWPAVLVMTTVVGVQAVIFQDGGLIALGTNIFNMAIVGVFVSYAFYVLIKKLTLHIGWISNAAVFLSAWVSIVVTSLACGLELALSGTSPANIVIPAMTIIHMLIGVGEGVTTVGAYSLISASRKHHIYQTDVSSNSNRGTIIAGTLIAITLTILSPLASSHPDGLEWVAGQKGFLSQASQAIYEILPDYTVTGVSDSNLSTILAGLIGAGIVAITIMVIARFRITKKSNEAG